MCLNGVLRHYNGIFSLVAETLLARDIKQRAHNLLTGPGQDLMDATLSGTKGDEGFGFLFRMFKGFEREGVGFEYIP